MARALFLSTPHERTKSTNRGAVSCGDVLQAKRPDLAEKVRAGDVKPAEAHRQMKRDAVADKVADLPSGKFVVLYADIFDRQQP